MNRILYSVVLLAVLAGCDLGGRVKNTKELTNEIKASQIKRVTNTQLIYSADAWGKKISQIAEKALIKELEKDSKKGAEFCDKMDRIPVVAAIEKEYGVKVELLGAADIQRPGLDPKEKELLEAYLYSAKTKTVASDNLQQLNDTLLVYNAPLSAGSVICKTCMSGPDSTFAVWRLLFSKKEIIRKLDAKQLKN